MIVIEVSGGLGNQMFQYALYKKMETLHKDVALDTSFFHSNQKLRKFELSIFDVRYRHVPDQEAAYIRGYGYQDTFFDKVKYKLKPSRYTIYYDLIERYQPEIFEMCNVYLSGYWQCEKYFKDIRNILLKEFSFPKEIKEKTANLSAELISENSVSIHIRRSDYLSEKNRNVYGNICTEQYYENAIDYVEQFIEKPKYYIFSDDLEWARNQFKGNNYVVVDKNRGKDSYIDMYLMSQCRCNIIANSSFSWWAAWLNQNPEKIVLAPKKWFQNHDKEDIVCEDWIRIEN